MDIKIDINLNAAKKTAFVVFGVIAFITLFFMFPMVMICSVMGGAVLSLVAAVIYGIYISFVDSEKNKKNEVK